MKKMGILNSLRNDNILSDTELETISTIIDIAHKDQKYGYMQVDYTKHLNEVTSLLYSVGCRNKYALIGGLLHDCLEDCLSEDRNKIKRLINSLGDTCESCISILTHDDDDLYIVYINKTFSTKVTSLVKLADIICNMRESMSEHRRGYVLDVNMHKNKKRPLKYIDALNYIRVHLFEYYDIIAADDETLLKNYLSYLISNNIL